MATWYCTQCGGSNVSSVQPSADASGNYMTGLCLACPKYATDRSGVVIQTGRVIVSGKPVETRGTPSPRKGKGKDPMNLWGRD